MLEILKMALNNSVALFFAVLFYLDFRKKINSLDNTISNHLTHALEKNTEITQKDAESTEKVEKAMIRVSESVDNLSSKMIEFLNKK